MAITRKPGLNRSAGPVVDIEDLINRGGSSPAATTPEEGGEKTVPVIVRLPASMLRSIDAAVRNRPVRIPRHTWLLEALHEKLSREHTEPDTE